MKHKFWVVFMAIVTALCMAFGMVGCGEKNPDEAGNNPSVVDPSGDEQGNQGNQGTQGGTQKPDESEQGPKPYTDELCFTEIHGKDGTTVIGYSVGAGEAADEEEIVIPSEHNNLPVLSICGGEHNYQEIWDKLSEEMSSSKSSTQKTEQDAIIQKYTFAYCSNLKKITIPDSVTLIGSLAFYGCRELTSVAIGNGVTRIDCYAFANCDGLTSMPIGNGVTTISSYAFASCDGLTELTISNHVTHLEHDAFSSCRKLTSVTIGSGVTEIGSFAFAYCGRLNEVHFENPNGWVVSKEQYLPTQPISGLDNATTAAKYLTLTYCNYYWKREG